MELIKSITIELDKLCVATLNVKTNAIMNYDETNGMQKALIQMFQSEINLKNSYEINSCSSELIEILRMYKEESGIMNRFIKLIESEI